MKIKDWSSARHLPALYRELKKLELLENIAELEAFGFTVLPPEKVGSTEEHQLVRDALLEIACSRKECTSGELTQCYADGQELLRFVIWDNPVFERVLLNPAAFGLIQYLLGTNCVLSLCDGWLKGKGNAHTNIHADWAQFEMPTFPPEPFTANFNYLLSDYSLDDGALSFVPGSHRWRRWPSPEEAEYWTTHAQHVEAPMGSMVIWGDHTWHGSFPRTKEGLRLMMLATFCRAHMQTQEPFRETVTQAALDRNPIRFGQLMDVQGHFPFGKSPRRPEKSDDRTKKNPGGYISLFDTKPANGAIETRPEIDYHQYDKEFANFLNERSKGTKIRFPDLYRTQTKKPNEQEQ